MSVKRDRMSTLITLNVRGFQIGGVSFKKRIGLLFEYLATTEVGELHVLVAPREADVSHELILSEPQGGVYASDHFGIAVTVKSN